MTGVIVGCVILLSLGAAGLARVRSRHLSVETLLVADRALPAPMLFILTVGEIYSIGSIVAFPAGLYAHGVSYGYWFLGYLLLAFPVGYFVGPAIWRRAKQYDACTLPEVFGRHFESVAFERLTAWACVMALVPWGQFQFIGLRSVLDTMGLSAAPAAGLAGCAVIAFSYVALGGVRASTYVAFLKDVLMLFGIAAVGVAAICMQYKLSTGHAQIITPTLPPPFGSSLVFAISTIIYQGIGFYFQPSVTPYLFTARSEQAVRRAMVFMPLYMLMYPFAVFATFFALKFLPSLPNPNVVFFHVAATLLPPWMVALAAAGALLAGLLVLAATSLNIAAMMTRNIAPGLGRRHPRRAINLAVILFLVLALVATTRAPAIMLTALNLSGYVGIQFASLWFLILTGWPVSPRIAGLGLLSGAGVAITLFASGAWTGGVNPGLIGLLANCAIVFCPLWRDQSEVRALKEKDLL
ncbi:Na+/solute symporter [Gluconacetobacter sacchari DSM 12717]|uniref:Sodium:solute symporter n=2 Tax=Gluconacetobacter sacchari TaxID=92759 RepID=A0A7W4NQU2_9PROT|nr:sodium:solute symporter [Gluconacetobacter sacchari]MBB2162732.1 sodium:solute symporter [Gluconacetobacter sacchari]GBQ25717.1 Na+/solute symporter [Gluconacetobacter sacchari DSM 12717]